MKRQHISYCLSPHCLFVFDSCSHLRYFFFSSFTSTLWLHTLFLYLRFARNRIVWHTLLFYFIFRAVFPILWINGYQKSKLQLYDAYLFTYSWISPTIAVSCKNAEKTNQSYQFRERKKLSYRTDEYFRTKWTRDQRKMVSSKINQCFLPCYRINCPKNLNANDAKT